MKKKNLQNKKGRRGWLWFCSIFFLLAAITYFPKFASFLFGVVGLGTLPVKKWQAFLESRLPEGVKKVKILLVIMIAVIGIMLSSGQEMKSQVNNDTIKITPVPELVQNPTVSPMPTETAMAISTEQPNAAPTEKSTEEPISEPTAEVLEKSYFEVHYIDVGHADAALVCCDGQYLLIDGGNADDSSLLYSYLKNKEVKHLNYVVATHAHEDHVGGIAGALNYASAGVVYCPVTDYDTEAFRNFKKYVEKAGVTITVPKAGDTFNVGSAAAEIVGVNGGSDENNTSIILRICYGETSFLFTGDAEREAEQEVLNGGYDISSTVLKVGHHGSANSTTYPFLREIMPSVAIISVGSNNGYGHPTEDVLSRLRDADVKVYRTDMQGNIVAKSDGMNVTVEVENNLDADMLAAQATLTPKPTVTLDNFISSGMESTGAYAVNGNNGKIHIVGACPATGKGKNAMKKPVYFDTYEQAEQHSIAIAPSEPKRKCGNCW